MANERITVGRDEDGTVAMFLRDPVWKENSHRGRGSGQWWTDETCFRLPARWFWEVMPCYKLIYCLEATASGSVLVSSDEAKQWEPEKENNDE